MAVEGLDGVQGSPGHAASPPPLDKTQQNKSAAPLSDGDGVASAPALLREGPGLGPGLRSPTCPPSHPPSRGQLAPSPSRLRPLPEASEVFGFFFFLFRDTPSSAT